MKCILLVCLSIVALGTVISVWAQVPEVDAYLTAGALEAGEKDLAEKILQNPADDQLRFGLALLHFLEGIETMVQAWHRYGLGPDSAIAAAIPFLRLSTPENANPEAISYEAFRAVFEDLVTKILKPRPG
jgi:hypothetical protein